MHRALRLVLIVALSWLTGQAELSASGLPPAERGFPLLRRFEPPVPEADSQNFDVKVDPRGQIFVANGGGVLTFDGAHWGYLPIGEPRTAFSLAIDDEGKVAVGGIDDFGLLEVNEKGSLYFRSLVDQVPPEQRPLGQISLVSTAHGFLFLADRSLFGWDGQKLEIVRPVPPGRPPARLFAVDGIPFLWTREEGLLRYDGQKFGAYPGGELFRGRRVDALLAAEVGLWVSVRGEGLFHLVDGHAPSFAPAASAWAVANRIFTSLRLPDGRYALGSLRGGVLLLTADGAIDQLIDSRVGLADDFVNGLAIDGEGALWLALDSGLERAELASPLTLIDRRAGLPGSVLSATRHRGRLYVGTTAGLFASIPSSKDARSGSPTLSFEPVEGMSLPVWSLLSLDDDLLLLGVGFGVSELHPDGSLREVAGTDAEVGYALQASNRFPGKIWLGTGHGVSLLRREKEGVVYEGALAGLAAGAVRSMVEKKGMLWCGTELEGVVGIELGNAFSAQKPQLWHLHGKKLVSPSLTEWQGEVLASQFGRSFFRIDEVNLEASKIPALLGLEGRYRVDTLKADAKGNLWIGTLPPTIALRQGNTWSTEPISLVGASGRNATLIYPEADGVTWIGTDRGLYRYGGDLRELGGTLPQGGFAEISTGDGRLFFGGALSASAPATRFPPQFRRLHVKLSPRTFREGLRYETLLDPIDTEWSRPSPNPEVELTRLPDGDYTLHARTRGSSGELSPESLFHFSVEPRWTERPWAYALYVLLAAILASSWAGLRSRALHRRAAELEAKVNEQTATLRQTVRTLRQTQSELESANYRLIELSSLDALTGIANRRPLEAELDREWSRAQRHGKPLAFLLLDLDHFKRLNDTYGHSEGDLCLRKVAQYLKSQLHRPGDLVARYGGEEFAVLLPETTLAQACEMAEKLRRGIEDFAMPEEESENLVTASFGVAVKIPAATETPQDLIEAADDALYEAKAQGRNRVCAAG